MEKVKIGITRYDLTKFFIFSEKNKIRFNGDCRIYSEAIYLTDEAGTSLHWNEEKLDDTEIKIVVSMLNLLIKSHKLHYIKGE